MRMKSSFILLCAVAVAVVYFINLNLSNGTTHSFRYPLTVARAHPELEGYDYHGLLNKIRNEDTKRLNNEIYVDYTGSGVYRDSQMNAIANDLKDILYGNPHSDSPSSLRANKRVEEMRDRILSWFHTDKSHYTVIFTSGATGALHMIGESFPWSSKSYYYYTQENHNSVLGIRQFAGDHGAHFHVVTEKDMCDLPYQSYNTKDDLNLDDEEEQIYNLFAFPAEENFSGKLFPLEYVNRVQGYNTFNKKGRWLVLLDAAAYVPTHSLNLTQYPADFVTLSFYKMFGYPTGVGCLIVNNEANNYMNKVYWGGGSVLQTVSRDEGSIRLPRSFTRRYEDGSPNFYGIMELEYGFRALEDVGGYPEIEKHMRIVTRYLYEGLHALHHSNGKPVMEIYGNHEETRQLYGNYYDNNDQKVDIYGDIQGPIVTCNVLTPEGTIVNFVDVEQNAAKYNIHVRAGWHCNPGATFKSLNMKEEEVIQQIQEYSCKDSKNCGHQEAITIINNVLAGGIRLSLGYLTTIEDCDAVISFFKTNYQQ